MMAAVHALAPVLVGLGGPAFAGGNPESVPAVCFLSGDRPGSRPATPEEARTDRMGFDPRETERNLTSVASDWSQYPWVGGSLADQARSMFFVAHAPRPTSALAKLAARSKGGIATERVGFHLKEGDIGPRGEVARKSLGDLKGVRVVEIDEAARLATVEIQILGCETLRLRPVESREFAEKLGAPLARLLQALASVGIEAEERR